MLDRHIPVFLEAATHFRVWILVRETNFASLRFVGHPGFVPKPIDCKAKTADQGHLAGLVVDPVMRGDAFSPNRLRKVLPKWHEFEATMRANRDWSVIRTPGDSHRGCVTLRGSCVHGDYDLKDVIDEEHFARNVALISQLRGQPHMVSREYQRVRDFINSRLKVRMIQHGASAQFEDHPDEDETVRAFGPNNVTATFHSTEELKRWYEMNQRVTLSLKASKHVGNPNWRPR